VCTTSLVDYQDLSIYNAIKETTTLEVNVSQMQKNKICLITPEDIETNLSGQRLRLNRHRACVSSGCRCRDYPDKDYDSLVTVLAFGGDADIFGCFLTFCIFRRHQAGFGAEHLKNNVRKYRYLGKSMRPDTTRWKPLSRRT
jgi:hypothetical protein